MNALDPAFVQTVWTVLAFAAFVGIALWAGSRRARRRFDEAQQLPFEDDANARQGGGGGR